MQNKKTPIKNFDSTSSHKGTVIRKHRPCVSHTFLVCFKYAAARQAHLGWEPLNREIKFFLNLQHFKGDGQSNHRPLQLGHRGSRIAGLKDDPLGQGEYPGAPDRGQSHGENLRWKYWRSGIVPRRTGVQVLQVRRDRQHLHRERFSESLTLNGSFERY